MAGEEHPMTAGVPLWALSERQNHRCAYCGFEMIVAGIECGSILSIVPRSHTIGTWGSRLRQWERAWKARIASFDHLLPRSKGGKRDPENGVVACAWCNVFRGIHPASHAYQKIQKLVRHGKHPHIIYLRTGRWIRSKAKVVRSPPIISASAIARTIEFERALRRLEPTA